MASQRKSLHVCFDEEAFCGIFDSPAPIVNIVNSFPFPDPFNSYRDESGIVVSLWTGAMKDYSVPRYARTRLVTIHKDLIYMICDLREMCCVHADWVFCWVRINHYHAGENAWNDGLYNLHEFNDVWQIRDVKFPRRSRIPQFFPLF